MIIENDITLIKLKREINHQKKQHPKNVLNDFINETKIFMTFF
jgi:hypothetical protein